MELVADTALCLGAVCFFALSQREADHVLSVSLGVTVEAFAHKSSADSLLCSTLLIGT